METIGTYLLFGGLIIVVLAQLVAAVIAFRLSALQGLLALFVPGYVLLNGSTSTKMKMVPLIINVELQLITGLTACLLCLAAAPCITSRL